MGDAEMADWAEPNNTSSLPDTNLDGQSVMHRQWDMPHSALLKSPMEPIIDQRPLEEALNNPYDRDPGMDEQFFNQEMNTANAVPEIPTFDFGDDAGEICLPCQHDGFLSGPTYDRVAHQNDGADVLGNSASHQDFSFADTSEYEAPGHGVYNSGWIPTTGNAQQYLQHIRLGEFENVDPALIGRNTAMPVPMWTDNHDSYPYGEADGGTPNPHGTHLPELEHVKAASRIPSDEPWNHLSPNNPLQLQPPYRGLNEHWLPYLSVPTDRDDASVQSSGRAPQTSEDPSMTTPRTSIPSERVPRSSSSVDRHQNIRSRRGSRQSMVHGMSRLQLNRKDSTQSNLSPGIQTNRQVSQPPSLSSRQRAMSDVGSNSVAPNDTTDRIRCKFPDCPGEFKGKWRKGNYKRHLDTVHGDDDIPCEEPQCNKTYRRTDARLKHYREYHPHLV